MTKVQSHVTLVLHNVRMVSSNVRKKIREPLNVTKIQSQMTLILHNMKMVPSNVIKYKETTEFDKSIVTCDVGTAQSDNGTIKCEKKNKETTEYDKSTVKYNVGTA